MTARYWFRPKRFGYGATPITWEGWLVTVVSALLVAAAMFLALGVGPQGAAARIAGAIAAAAIVIAIVAISKAKTEGGWKWRWGDRE